MKQTSDLNTYFSIQPIDYKSIVSEFNKTIHDNRFIINLDYLLYEQNFDYVDFSKGVWSLRPDFFCADHYEHPHIYPLILLVNNLKTIFEFIPENIPNNLIIAPKISKIIKLLTT